MIHKLLMVLVLLLGSSAAAQIILPGCDVHAPAGVCEDDDHWSGANAEAVRLFVNGHETRLNTIEAIDLLVGTASAALPGGIVVGTAPGGVLGGSWASPTLDDLACTEAKLASEDFGAFTCGAGADDCLLDAGSVSLTASVTGTLPVANGGTGATTLTNGGLLFGAGTSPVSALGVATNGQLPIGDGSGAPTLATISPTTNETTVTNTAGGISVGLPDDVTITDELTVTGALTVGGQSLGLMTLSTNTTTTGTTSGTRGDINVETDATANNVCINTSATTGTTWLCGDFN